MTRGRPPRPWIKWFPQQWINGTARYRLDITGRAIFHDLVNFSALCPQAGRVADNDGRPFPHNFLATRFNVDLQVFEDGLRQCVDEGCIVENGEGLFVTHWHDYQSEYQRQKPYRAAAKERDYAGQKYKDMVATDQEGIDRTETLGGRK